MFNCQYPGCVMVAQSEGESPSLFCMSHAAMKCNFPPCEALVTTAQADLCLEHYGQAHFFTWLHTIRHVQARKAMEARQQGDAVLKKLTVHGNGLDIGGGRILRKR